MSDPTEGRKANDFHILALRRLDRSRDNVLAGDATPSMSDRFCGLPPLADNPIADLRRVATIEIDTGRHKGRVSEGLRRLVDAPSAVAAVRVSGMLGRNDDELRYSFLWLAALLGHQPATQAVVTETLRGVDLRRTPIQNTRHLALAIGLASRWPHTEPTDAPYKPGHLEALVDHGLHVLRDAARAIEIYDDAEAQIEQSIADPATVEPNGDTAEGSAIEDLLRATLEDRAEVSTTGRLAHLAEMQVVPALDAKNLTGARKDAVKAFADIAGKQLPLIELDGMHTAVAALSHRFPHFNAEIDIIMRSQAARSWPRFRVLLVGSPGCGKTALAGALALAMGLPSTVYACGGQADGSFGGTSAQWYSSRPSVPLQLVHSSKTANPLVILDEIEKAASSRTNGALVDSLLSYLEPMSAAHVRDLCLEVDVDLSGVSYVATANSIDDVPAPLRDRFKIIRMPDAGWQHIGQLTANILDDLARERELDRRWIEPLGQDELELVRQAWTGGSLRQLTRILTTIVDGRDHLIGRA